MKSYKNSPNSGRRSRKSSVNTDRFSEEARRGRRDRSDSQNYQSFNEDHTPEGAYVGAYSRQASQAEYTKRRKSKKRKRIALVAVIALVAILLGGAGFALAYYNNVQSNLHEGLDADLGDVLIKPTVNTDPFYILLMGVDSSEERENSAEYAGDTFRSDSIILARIDPGNSKVTLVSIHRDTMVDMGVNGVQKINAARALGGPSYAVEVISEFAGVPISHYAEINFDGFKQIIDALGGVEVDVPMEINDDMAGGYVAAGPQTLNGDQALILARSRHAYDDYGDGDTYRAANQRLVISAMAKKILTTDLITMASTITTLSEYVTTDYDIAEIIELAQSMQGFNPETDMYSAMTPTTSSYIDEIWYEVLNEAEWKTMMARVDQGLPPTEETIIDENTGTVLATAGDGTASNETSESSPTTTNNLSGTGSITVKNGTTKTGAASSVAEVLEAAGYTVEAGNANSTDYTTTVVVYGTPEQADEAQRIADAVGATETYLNSDGSYNLYGDFLIVIGSDWVQR